MTARSLGCWAWMVVSSVASLAVGADEAAAPDLNGVWRGFVVSGKGEDPNRGSTHLELTIKGNRIDARQLDGEGGSLGHGVYKMTPGKALSMDATETGKRGKPPLYLGICAVNEDVLKWCVATPGNKRPTNMETKSQQFLLIVRRQK